MEIIETRPGDVILTWNECVKDRIVSVITNSEWCHAALATGRGTFIESNRKRGVIETGIVRNDRFAMMRHTFLSEREAKNVVCMARAFKGRRYGMSSNIEVIFRMMLGRRKYPSSAIFGFDKLNCSQLVAMAYSLVGIGVHPDYDPRLILPRDFMTSPFFKRVDKNGVLGK